MISEIGLVLAVLQYLASRRQPADQLKVTFPISFYKMLKNGIEQNM